MEKNLRKNRYGDVLPCKYYPVARLLLLTRFVWNLENVFECESKWLPDDDSRQLLWCLFFFPKLINQTLMSLGLKPLSTRRSFHHCIVIHKCLIWETDFNLNFIKNEVVLSCNTRYSNCLWLPLPQTNWGNKYLSSILTDWNSLPPDMKETSFISIFKSKLETFLENLN